MIRTLAKSGTSSRVIALGESILKRIEKLENDKVTFSSRRARYEADLRKAKAGRNMARVAVCQRDLAPVLAQCKAIETALKETYEAWEKLVERK
jgi:hypothetical protein